MKRLLALLPLLALPCAFAQSKVTVNADQTVSVNGAKFFPISLYVQSDWAGVKGLGANAASRPFCVNTDALTKSRKKHLYLHYTAGPGCDDDNAAAIKKRDASGFVASIDQARGFDYLFGYGLPDEPVSSEDLSPADTKWAYGVIKGEDPDHPVLFTDYAGDIAAYKDGADIFLNDEYPFNNDSQPLYDIKTKLVKMQAQVAPKPAWLIIQTGSQFGMPTDAQIRAETYLSIALGSTGVIFYSYDEKDEGGVHNIKKDGDPAYMTSLIGELTDFSSFLVGNKDASLSYTSSDVDAILRDDAGKSYLVAVNKNAGARNVSFTLAGFGGATATIIGRYDAGSTRTGQVKTLSSSGVLADALQGLEAVVYEITRKKAATDEPAEAHD